MASISSTPDEWGLVWTGRHTQAYDEPVFRHLLALERARAARLDLPLLVLLIALQPAPTSAARLFSGLSTATRETDIVGWHRRERVAGVVVTELGDRPLGEVSALLQARVAAALDRSLPAGVAHRVHARIYRHPRPTGSLGAPADVGAGEDECSISA